jgi:hypothetical protein
VFVEISLSRYFAMSTTTMAVQIHSKRCYYGAPTVCFFSPLGLVICCLFLYFIWFSRSEGRDGGWDCGGGGRERGPVLRHRGSLHWMFLFVLFLMLRELMAHSTTRFGTSRSQRLFRSRRSAVRVSISIVKLFLFDFFSFLVLSILCISWCSFAIDDHLRAHVRLLRRGGEADSVPWPRHRRLDLLPGHGYESFSRITLFWPSGAYTLTAASNFNGFESPSVYYKIFTSWCSGSLCSYFCYSFVFGFVVCIVLINVLISNTFFSTFIFFFHCLIFLIYKLWIQWVQKEINSIRIERYIMIKRQSNYVNYLLAPIQRSTPNVQDESSSPIFFGWSRNKTTGIVSSGLSFFLFVSLFSE